MSVDNRTELNDCESATGWTGDGAAPAVNSTTGQFYQGSGSIESQHTNADEHMSTTEDSLNTGTFSIDMSDSTVYIQLKDNLINTLANGGVQIVIGDGTNKVGYDVGGNDSNGLPLPTFFNAYKLDVSNLPAAFNAYTGSEASLSTTAITEVGVGTLHLAKAVGNVGNIFVDYISYIANGSPALTINGGTSGTPETMADVAGDDITNGWGMVSNPFGKQYLFFAPVEWGDSGTASSYFSATNEQWFLLGNTAGAGNFDFGLTANLLGTNSFELTNVVIVGLDVRSNFNFAPANHNIMHLTSVTFTDIGAITLPSVSINKSVDSCIFNNCDQLTPSTCDFMDSVFNGTTDANGAMLVNTSTINMSGLTFNSDGTGHAIYITVAGAYTFNGFSFNGYGANGTTNAAVYNNSGGAVVINLSGGSDSPSYRNGTGASTTIQVIYNLTLTDIPSGVNVTIVNSSTRTELQHSTSSGSNITYSHGGGETVDILLNSLAYDPNLSDIYDLTLPNANSTIKFQMIDDLNYDNPA